GGPRLGVAQGGGVIAIDVSEVALPVHQRIALRKVLREPYQRVIDRLVAVRVEGTPHIADDLGGFLERRSRIESQQAHAIENAAVYRLEAVARIGQGPIHNRGKGISEVALFQRVAQRNLFNVTFVGGNQSLSHA